MPRKRRFILKTWPAEVSSKIQPELQHGHLTYLILNGKLDLRRTKRADSDQNRQSSSQI